MVLPNDRDRQGQRPPDLKTEEEAIEYMSISGCERPAYIEKLLFTKAQAAEMLNMKVSSIEWLIRKGGVPHRKIAGKIRFTQSDLQALIEASAVTQCCAAKQKGA